MSAHVKICVTLVVFLDLFARTYGNFTCYACLDAVLTNECYEVKRCASHEACFLDAYTSAIGLEFEMGCRDTAQCGMGKRDVLEISDDKRASSNRQLQCAQCCSDNLCNDALCGQKGLSQLGPICYSCPQHRHPDDCNNVEQCGRDQVCMLEQFMAPHAHQYIYHSLCTEKSECSRRLDAMRMFGKRYSDEFHSGSDLKIKCCDTDLCNDGPGGSSSSSTASHTPHASTDHCSSHPCVRGQCYSSPTDFVCSCPTGYTGKTCNTVSNHCSSSPCGSHGTCYSSSSGYYCRCSGGYTGSKCQTPPTPACKRDIVFMLDMSNSIGSSIATKGVTFIQDIINHLDIDPNHALTSLVSFSSHAYVEWKLNSYYTKNDVISALLNIKYHAGSTHIADALHDVLTTVFTNSNGDRSDADDVVVILSDGGFNDMSTAVTFDNQLKTITSDIFAIAVGRVSTQEMTRLETLATDANHVIDATSLTSLNQHMSQIIHNICN